MIDNQIVASPLLPEALRQPTIVSWNRLEPRPRSPNFERALRAEIRDALWMLTRQWQFGEFKGNDAGTATFAKVQIDAELLETLTHPKMLQPAGNQRHAGMRGNRFSGEAEAGISLADDFTRTAFFAISCLHPFDDPFSRGWPRVNSSGSLIKGAFLLVN